MILKSVHHVALIVSDYARAKAFYVDLLGLEIIAETYREARDSMKLDLALADGTQLEIFTFPGAPVRPSPEAQGLRHLAFCVDDVAACKHWLEDKGVDVEPIRIDQLTQRKFTFFKDPDGLPLELYED